MKKVYIIMFGISVLLMIGAVVTLFFYGLKFGVDFKGGSVLELAFPNGRPSLMDLSNSIKSIDKTKDVNISSVGDRGIIVRGIELSEQEHQVVLNSLRKTFPDNLVEELKFDSVGPVIGQELKTKSVRAIVIVLVAIALYIAFVFRKIGRALSPWAMSLATMVALVHDVVIPLGVFAVLGKFQGVEISAVFVAAVLTILGYSISDTVVVFDRVRENVIRGGLAKESFSSVVHRSIMQTLVRSLNTTLTTLLSLIAIYFFGGESIRYFALALILGISAGAYSSIFVASPILVWLSRGSRR